MHHAINVEGLTRIYIRRSRTGVFCTSEKDSFGAASAAEERLSCRADMTSSHPSGDDR